MALNAREAALQLLLQQQKSGGYANLLLEHSEVMQASGCGVALLYPGETYTNITDFTVGDTETSDGCICVWWRPTG